MTKVRHFKSLLDINKKEFIRIIERAIALKEDLFEAHYHSNQVLSI